MIFQSEMYFTCESYFPALESFLQFLETLLHNLLKKGILHIRSILPISLASIVFQAMPMSTKCRRKLDFSSIHLLQVPKVQQNKQGRDLWCQLLQKSLQRSLWWIQAEWYNWLRDQPVIVLDAFFSVSLQPPATNLPPCKISEM